MALSDRVISGGSEILFCNGAPYAKRDADGTIHPFVTDGSKQDISTRAVDSKPLPFKDYDAMPDEHLANCLSSDAQYPPASYWVDYEEDHRRMLKAAARRIMKLRKETP